MVNKVRSATKRRFRKTNFDAFVFFLFFAIVVWIFVQFSKQYSVIVDIPVEYVNVPLNKFLTEDNPETLQMRMENSGFKIAWYSLFPPTFRLDISKTEQAGEQLIYRTVDNRVEIQNQLDIDFENSQFLKKVLTIDFEPRQEKILPVFSEIKVEFAVGYAADDEISITPDSVKISGPEAVLDTLEELHTEPLNIKNVSEDLSGTVALDTSNLEQVSFYKNQVSYKLDVEKFTEGKVKVPVELTHVPQGMNVVI
ncbi:MAG TPA: YbbR-like domain-containing protein, partial [Salinimicrobium sp.]|nr:YbbR-like domain-containing protein [Salinimicrobium sp.]